MTEGWALIFPIGLSTAVAATVIVTAIAAVGASQVGAVRREPKLKGQDRPRVRARARHRGRGGGHSPPHPRAMAVMGLQEAKGVEVEVEALVTGEEPSILLRPAPQYGSHLKHTYRQSRTRGLA